MEATLETRSATSVRARLVVDLGSSALSLRLANSFVEKHRDAFAGLHGVVAPIGAGVGGAAEAGLQPGDVIEKLDGHEVTARDLHSLRRALRDAESTVLLHVRRLGSVPLALRKLV